jgi:hypothetical protein
MSTVKPTESELRQAELLRRMFDFKRAELSQRAVKIEQMMDIELDPGSDLYRELRSFLSELKEAWSR